MGSKKSIRTENRNCSWRRIPEKCWGDENFTELTKLLLKNTEFNLCIVGSEEDGSRIKVEQTTKIKNLCGKLSLRQSAAFVYSADFVISNTSLCMHLAGAFKIPSITLLGSGMTVQNCIISNGVTPKVLLWEKKS